MKTILRRNDRAGAIKLKLPRARLLPANRSRHVFAPTAEPALAPARLAPAAVAEDVIPAAYPRGDTLQLYLREIGQVEDDALVVGHEPRHRVVKEVGGFREQLAMAEHDDGVALVFDREREVRRVWAAGHVGSVGG